MKCAFFFLAPLLLIIPAVAAATLDSTDSTARYTDAPFRREEAAAISILTNLGVLEGNPDGTFAPERAINRAEFLKIILKSQPGISVVDSDAAACFPDVSADAWFSPAVCLGAKRGIVKGYPDGSFRPAQIVNYVEAIKMLEETYDVPWDKECVQGTENADGGCTLRDRTFDSMTTWYVPYMAWARTEGLLLPTTIAEDAPLTRGQMARLAASFRAWKEGELPAYRALETGKRTRSSRSSSASGAVSVSQVSVSSRSSRSTSSSPAPRSSLAASEVGSVSSVSSVSSVQPLFPAISRFPLLGSTSPVLADGLFTFPDEEATLKSVNVLLFRQVKSFDKLVLVDEAGKEWALLALALADNTDELKWEVQISGTGGYRFSRDSAVRLGIRARMKGNGAGGVANELIEIREFTLRAQGLTTGATRHLVPSDPHLPMHQTAMGRIAGVMNTLATSLTVPQGAGKTLASFSVAGRTATGGSVQLSDLTFALIANDVNVSKIKIGGPSALQQSDCGIESGEAMMLVTCAQLPEGFRNVGDGVMTLSLYGDLALRTGASAGTLQLRSLGAGSIGKAGALRWSDGVGTYVWVESDIPLEHGPMVTISR